MPARGYLWLQIGIGYNAGPAYAQTHKSRLSIFRR
jgi:hypothetical protein